MGVLLAIPVVPAVVAALIAYPVAGVGFVVFMMGFAVAVAAPAAS